MIRPGQVNIECAEHEDMLAGFLFVVVDFHHFIKYSMICQDFRVFSHANKLVSDQPHILMTCQDFRLYTELASFKDSHN